MMFGLDSKEKELKELLARLGCEASVFRNFKNGYEKMDKRYAQTASHYQSCLAATVEIRKLAERLEQHFIGQDRMDLSETARELKKMQGTYAHEFIISSQDKEFSSTYDTLIRKLPLVDKGKENALMMQSEVENLLQILQENLNRKKPDLYALSFFLADHKISELYDLSAERKRELVHQKMVNELIMPLQNALKHTTQSPEYKQIQQLILEMTGVTI